MAIKNENATESDMANKNEQAAGSKNERGSTLIKHKIQTIKIVLASINERESVSKMDSNPDSHSYETSTNAFADKPPIKTLVCFSINQIEVLENLGNYTFAAQFEADDFLQKVIFLLKRPDATKVNRLPAPWREKFKCFSLDSNDFLYKDEKLVILKVLGSIILRSLHYGHPGRDSMLATVSNGGDPVSTEKWSDLRKHASSVKQPVRLLGQC